MKAKFINKITFFIASTMTAALLMQAGCKGTDAPVFISPDGDVMVGLNEPDVNDELAEEAWQKRFIFHVGPVDLPAGAKMEEMVDAPLAMRFQSDEDIWVTAFEPKVVDAAGSELPSGLLRQAIVSNLHEENSMCGNSGAGNPAFIATALLTRVELPQGYGYPVLSTDPLEVSVMLENPTEQSYSGVYFEITLVARPMNEFSSLSDVKPMLVEFEPCGHEAMDIEPSAFAERTVSYRMAAPSRVIMVSGALSDFGASIELSTGGGAIPFWRSEATLDEGHKLLELSDNPYVDLKTEIAEGDEVTLGATFDNTSGSWLKSATASAMMYVNPSE